MIVSVVMMMLTMAACGKTDNDDQKETPAISDVLKESQEPISDTKEYETEGPERVTVPESYESELGTESVYLEGDTWQPEYTYVIRVYFTNTAQIDEYDFMPMGVQDKLCQFTQMYLDRNNLEKATELRIIDDSAVRTENEARFCFEMDEYENVFIEVVVTIGEKTSGLSYIYHEVSERIE